MGKEVFALRLARDLNIRPKYARCSFPGCHYRPDPRPWVDARHPGFNTEAEMQRLAKVQAGSEAVSYCSS
jgi:hypothetical protein